MGGAARRVLAVAAALAALAPPAGAMGNHPAQASVRLNGGAAGGNNGHTGPAAPEALLVKTLIEIKNNRLDAALGELDKVLQTHPHFRLAHLIRGDLLLARTRPLTTVGNAAGIPEERLADLREEARARLARYRHERPADRVPRYLVQLQPEQKHAFVVDTSKATLYVFENRDGSPRYLADYYISIGRNGIDKAREGDKKTPLGVYHVTQRIERDRLNALYGRQSDLYGAGALPINYPNEWDRRQGRNGHGIWLHGVPFDTYSRPPRASDGCVALTNEDFETIGRVVQVGLTPVIISSGVEWVPREATEGLRRGLQQALEAWRRDWESLDTERYLRHYAAGFRAGRQDLAAWAAQKRQVNAGKRWIKVGVDKVSVFLYPGNQDLAVVTFEQDYASSNLANQMRKRQYWIREGGAWKILHEGAA
jgi:murein L,D-transpeptidase YafK